MYKYNDLYLKFCILCSILLTIQKVCIGSTFQSTLGMLW